MTLESKALLAAAFALLSAVMFNAAVPLYVDEAYYWLWSKHLSMGYYDHPYMIAYLIKLFTLGGDEIWKIRLVNLVCFSGAAFFVFKTADFLFGRSSALYALILFILSPAVTMGLTITTPDSPLIFFWSASLYFAAKAFFDKQLGHYLLAGAAAGLALSSKYTAILLPAGFFLYLTFKEPRELTTSRPYLALLACVIAFAPVLVWNAQNGFVSFAFQLHHGAATGTEGLHLMDDLAFFGGMAAMFNPLFFILFVYAAFSQESYRDKRMVFLLVPALFTIAFFLYKGIYKKMELNWVAPAFISASIALSRFIVFKQLYRAASAGIILSLLLMAIIRFPLSFGLEGKRNPQNRLFGYEELARHLQTYPARPVYADHLTLASSLTYYLDKPVWIPTSTRSSEFDRWQQGADWSARPGIYVSRNDRTDELRTLWKHVDLSEIYTAKKPGFSDKSFYVYKVSN